MVLASVQGLLQWSPPLSPFKCVHNPKRQRAVSARISTDDSPPSTQEKKKSLPGKPEADVVVIGSGIAGLCCAGLLARYNQDVLVLESHDQPGGAAHAFDIKGYKFDSGPSLFSGFQSRGPQANPLAQVLDALGESVPCANYDSWMVYLPEGEFLSRIGPTEFFKDLEKYASQNAVQEWKKLMDAVLPMSAAAMALPPLSVRGDLGVLSTAAARYAPSLLKSFIQMGPQGAIGTTKLLRPFSEIIDSLELKDPFVRNWVDLLAFLLAGVKSNDLNQCLHTIQSGNCRIDMVPLEWEIWDKDSGLSAIFLDKLRDMKPRVSPWLSLLSNSITSSRMSGATTDATGPFVIMKPLRASMLVASLQHVMGVGNRISCSNGESPSLSLRNLFLGRKILVADDNIVNLRVAEGALKKYGADVVCTDSGEKAIALLGPPHDFDVCFVDIQMPGMDGFEATKRIREMEQIPRKEFLPGQSSSEPPENISNFHLPILAMTADVIHATLEECTKYGMDGYVSKPFEAEQLFREVSRFFPVIIESELVERPP